MTTVFDAAGPLTDLCLPPIAKDAEHLLPLLSLHPPSTSLFRPLRSVPYHFNSPVFVLPGRVRSAHGASSSEWPVVPLSARSRAKYTSSSVSFTTVRQGHSKVTSRRRSALLCRGLLLRRSVEEPTLSRRIPVLDPRAIGRGDIVIVLKFGKLKCL